MLPLPVCIFAYCCLLSGPGVVMVVATETLVGVAGQAVRLPCRLKAAGQSDVQVCWGRGKPALFHCHNTLINAAGDQVTYRQSHRFSVSSTSTLSISDVKTSDGGFYHCRVQIPGLFNDQTFSVLLIVRAVDAISKDQNGVRKLNKSNITASPNSNVHQNHPESEVTLETGSDTTQGDTTGSDITGIVTQGYGTEPVIALVKTRTQPEQDDSLHIFVGGTLRLAFIIFIPALLLTLAYRVCRSERRLETNRNLQPSEEESSSV